MSEKTTPTNNFVEKNLAELNKSEDVKQREAIQEFVDNATIEANTQITLIETSELPKLQQKLKKAQLAQTKAEKAFEKARFTMSYSFEAFVGTREQALDAIEKAKDSVDAVNEEISDANNKLAQFKEILADLS